MSRRERSRVPSEGDGLYVPGGVLGAAIVMLALVAPAAGDSAYVVATLAAAQQATVSEGTVGLPREQPAFDPELEERTSDVASDLRCPVCQGLSVEDSPTELALQMRAVVREQLAAGRSPAEVKAYFVDKYGEWILLEPEASGFNLIVYVLPWLAVLAGAALIVLVVRRWTRPAFASPND